MNDIVFTQEFGNHLRQRANKRIKGLFKERLKIFQKNPHDGSLFNHALKHDQAGHRSWSLTDDEGSDDF